MDENHLPLIVPPANRPGVDAEDISGETAERMTPTEPAPRQIAVYNRFMQSAVAIWVVSLAVISVAVAALGFPDDVGDPGDGAGDFIAVMGIVGVLLLLPAALAYGAWSRWRPRSSFVRAIAHIAQFVYLGFLAILMIVTWEDNATEGISATTWLLGAMALGFAAQKTIAPRAPGTPDVVQLQDS